MTRRVAISRPPRDRGVERPLTARRCSARRRQVAARRDPAEALRRQERGDRARLLLADLHEQRPPGPQHAGRGGDEPAEHAMPSGPPSRASAGLPGARPRRASERMRALGRYGGLATTRSSAQRRARTAARGGRPRPARTRSAEAEARARCPRRRRAAAGELLDRRDRGARAAGPRGRRRWRPIPCRRRRRAALGLGPQDLERPLDQPLGLRARDEHVRDRRPGAGRGTPRTRGGAAGARRPPAARGGARYRSRLVGRQLPRRARGRRRSGRSRGRRRAATPRPRRAASGPAAREDAPALAEQRRARWARRRRAVT